MSYSTAELEEMLQNDAFLLWVLQPDENSNQYWNDWALLNPGKKELLLKAKELVQLLHDAEKEKLSPTEKDQIATGAWHTIHDRINNKNRVVRLGKSWYNIQ